MTDLGDAASHAAASPAALSAGGLAIACWGIGGVLALLAQAVWRLTPLALEPLGKMTRVELALYVSWSVFNAWAEGYRGFQRSFVPRAVARALFLAQHPRPLHVALAPLFCMALIHATRRALIGAWALLVGIVVLVVLVRRLPQPWRGIVDAGVVVGLVWGAVALAVMFVAAVRAGATGRHASLPAA